MIYFARLDVVVIILDVSFMKVDCSTDILI